MFVARYIIGLFNSTASAIPQQPEHADLTGGIGLFSPRSTLSLDSPSRPS